MLQGGGVAQWQRVGFQTQRLRSNFLRPHFSEYYILAGYGWYIQTKVCDYSQKIAIMLSILVMVINGLHVFVSTLLVLVFIYDRVLNEIMPEYII